MANDDQLSGTVRNLKGRAQTAAGSLTDDAETQARGAVNQAAGRAQGFFGRARSAVKETAEDLRDDADLDDLAEEGHTMLDDAMEQGRYYKRRAARYVEDNTGVTLIAVAAASFMFGLLLGANRRD